MAVVVYTAFNPSNASVGSGAFIVPAKGRADVSLDDATGIANFKTLLDAGCVLVRKDTLADRSALHSVLRKAGVHYPGS